jgi:Zn-dependent M28 family amino/carboxypeptidase
VSWQRFTAQQRSQRRPVEMANLIVRWYPERTRRVILCSHYDTRPIADQERDMADWMKPFVSANDGGSGVAWLMEMAHHMKDLPTQVGVDFVIFDGEEYIFDRQDKYFFGSEHFAETYRKERPAYRYTAAVLLDMIAGKNPRFPIEINSYWGAGPLVEEIWGLAAELRLPAFQFRQGHRVDDDHLALLKVGIPAVDIIDFDYPHWHRLSDVPENCSEEGMAQVARLLMVWLQRAK